MFSLILWPLLAFLTKKIPRQAMWCEASNLFSLSLSLWLSYVSQNKYVSSAFFSTISLMSCGHEWEGLFLGKPTAALRMLLSPRKGRVKGKTASHTWLDFLHFRFLKEVISVTPLTWSKTWLLVRSRDWVWKWYDLILSCPMRKRKEGRGSETRKCTLIMKWCSEMSV